MKTKIYVAIVAIIIGAGIFWFVRTGQTSPTTTPSNATSSSAAGGSPSTTPTSYKDGTYTGNATDMEHGIVQVSAVISGGKLTDVQFLQLPQDGRSGEISSLAGPQLRSEALKTQSAQVDIVSGATQTSQAFAQSLQSALSQAGA
ncbi:MAG TPA: FMN-binding protein [Candidatus Saccharimonadia bacterium]|nr:FMN-binding protein [Candidatus Saccharimonadia bacterium]